LGDFGLATTHRNRKDDGMEGKTDTPSLYEGMDDISSLMDHPVISSNTLEPSSGGESMTGGVGTTFYRAPEQEERSLHAKKGDTSSYTVQADIFSFGIILFEMFHPPFPTYMERAETLTVLRGDRLHDKKTTVGTPSHINNDFKALSFERFPSSCIDLVPENAQR
jgi:serine/threonine protein kinase